MLLIRSRKFICWLLSVVVLFISGCDNTAVTDRDLKINTDINCNIVINDKSGKKYMCELVNTPQKFTSVKFLYPDSLKDVCFKSNCGKFEIVYDGLKCESDKNFFTESSIFSRITQVINTVNDSSSESKKEYHEKNANEENWSFCYKSDAYYCDFSVDNDGNVKKIFFPNDEITVEFL